MSVARLKRCKLFRLAAAVFAGKGPDEHTRLEGVCLVVAMECRAECVSRCETEACVARSECDNVSRFNEFESGLCVASSRSFRSEPDEAAVFITKENSTEVAERSPESSAASEGEGGPLRRPPQVGESASPLAFRPARVSQEGVVRSQAADIASDLRVERGSIGESVAGPSNEKARVEARDAAERDVVVNDTTGRAVHESAAHRVAREMLTVLQSAYNDDLDEKREWAQRVSDELYKLTRQRDSVTSCPDPGDGGIWTPAEHPRAVGESPAAPRQTAHTVIPPDGAQEPQDGRPPPRPTRRTDPSDGAGLGPRDPAAGPPRRAPAGARELGPGGGDTGSQLILEPAVTRRHP